MATIFLAGSISIKRLDSKVKERIDNIVASGHNVIVGDASGVDSAIQAYLLEKSASAVIVFCSGDTPRNNIGRWEIRRVEAEATRGSRSFYTAKDLEMARAADFGMMVWDTKSSGTLNNVIELLSQKKKSVVFVNESRLFKNVSDVADLETLVSLMTARDLRNADEKLRLNVRIQKLKQEQADMFR
jgi:hypothetical protein